MNLLERFNHHKEMVDDGWVLTKTGTDTVKWILQNPKYNYRDFYHHYKPNVEQGVHVLIRNLQIKIKTKKIKLDYHVCIKANEYMRKQDVA